MLTVVVLMAVIGPSILTALFITRHRPNWRDSRSALVSGLPVLLVCWCGAAFTLGKVITGPSIECEVEGCAMSIATAAMLFVLALVPFIVAVASAALTIRVANRGKVRANSDKQP